MALLHVAVLVRLGRVDRLALQAVVLQQPLIAPTQPGTARLLAPLLGLASHFLEAGPEGRQVQFLQGEWVEARLHADHIEVWYAQRLVERLPRLRGRGKHRIAYRHVIDWLVRKPGAFAEGIERAKQPPQ